MHENVIIHRVFDHLRKYPPFDKIEARALLSLCKTIKVSYFPKATTIFKKDGPPGEYFYFVQEGSVQLFLEDEVLDHCDQGDVFGVRSMLSGNPYVLRARCWEDALLYCIPVKQFRKIMDNNPQVALYFASGLAGGQLALRDTTSTINLYGHTEAGTSETKIQAPPIVSCLENDSVKEAASLMTDRKVGSLVIVDRSGLPIGILTDADLRKKVATGQVAIEETVTQIMSSPVITVPPSPKIFSAVNLMLENNVRHLCVTEDGSAQTRAIGVISQRDVLLASENNPATIVKEIHKATETGRLKELRDRVDVYLKNHIATGAGAAAIAGTISRTNDALIKKAIDLSLTKLKADGNSFPDVPFAWLSLGSEGREEQLLRTDLDNALIYVDNGQTQGLKEAFLDLGREVNDILIQCGFAKCVANIMASAPDCCLSLEEWKEKFRNWTHTPTPEAVMRSNIFFDFRSVSGETSLGRELSDYLIDRIRNSDLFLAYMAKNAVSTPPPLSFFKNFIVEKSGDHKDEFDIKKRALMPLADAARVLCLSKGSMEHTNTSERYRELGRLEEKNTGLFEEAAMAYDYLLSLRTRFGIENNNDGRFVPVERLNKLEKQILRNTFVPIRELQQLLEVRFRLDYIRN